MRDVMMRFFRTVGLLWGAVDVIENLRCLVHVRENGSSLTLKEFKAMMERDDEA